MATLYDLKEFLRIEQSYTDEDETLENYLLVANNTVYNYLNGATFETVPAEVDFAILMLAAHLYINRNIVSFANAVEMPFSFKFLLDPYKIPVAE